MRPTPSAESINHASPAAGATGEIERGDRFGFGANWTIFLEKLNEDRIRLAEASLRDILEVDRLDGKRFLDIGSGSGLFSLAARRLGATVHSFDFDPQSVACTRELKARFFKDDLQWRVDEASILDRSYLQSLGTWDVVYSWGVLHHTGAMWEAMDNAVQLVGSGGKLYVAIYNYQHRISPIWLSIKRSYNRLPPQMRWLVVWPTLVRIWGPRTLLDFAQAKPFYTWRHYAEGGLRGMSAWSDLIDWVGGYPFEVAKPEEVIDFCRKRGLGLARLRTAGGGHGCNEFMFTRTAVVTDSKT